MTTLDIGSFVEKYQILRCLSEGYVSLVYEARAPGELQSVAIKVLRDFWPPTSEMAQRFANEKQALHNLRHPNIVGLLGSGMLPSGEPYIILEWLPFDLARILDKRPAGLGFAHSVRIGVQIARALFFLHGHNIIHRDVKAGNVLLDSDDLDQVRVRLGDLGLSKVAPEHRSSAGMNISTGGGKQFGTWDYMAPEQWLKSKTVGFTVDVYALGVLLFQLISGTLPFVAGDAKGLMAMHLFKEPPLMRLGGDVLPAFRQLIQRMLGKTPKERPTMTEVLERLEMMANAKG